MNLFFFHGVMEAWFVTTPAAITSSRFFLVTDTKSTKPNLSKSNQQTNFHFGKLVPLNLVI